MLDAIEVRWSLAEVEAALGRVHGIAGEKRASFQARLKNLLKLGLLPERARGRGRAASYSAQDFVVFALAVELMQFSVPPERIAQLARDKRHVIAEAMLRAAASVRSGPSDQNNTFLAFDPKALSSHRLVPLEQSFEADPDFYAADLRDLKSSVAAVTAKPGRARLGVVNLRALLAELVSGMRDDAAVSMLDQLHRCEI